MSDESVVVAGVAGGALFGASLAEVFGGGGGMIVGALLGYVVSRDNDADE
ncbi:hypothetical protein [Halorarum salinum]|uniref:Glycine zipper domain-containing protein n=1 Tax=Halorarum salinum TaxID=2743089 RepID=A0A7D5LAG4_9EURY|nr:hypothetical protein [Halobaculum salinum]QLG62052.1 hypothetical protein HUG12_10065 [Halobaculum salinum]